MVWRNDQVSEVETAEILRIAELCLNIEGDFVEMGCYKGDTALLLAEVLREYNSSCGKLVENFGNNRGELDKKFSGGMKKKLWIYDSFEGLPEKSEVDKSEVGADFQPGELKATKREVKERFLRAGLPLPEIKKRWFEDLTDEDLPIVVAFAFIDGDFYQSIKVALLKMERRMAKGGIMVVHDYNNPALPGVAKAVEEWRVGKNLRTRQFASLMVIEKEE